MLSIPDGLHEDPARPTVYCDGVWVVDYTADTPTFSLPVVVTRPTFVVIHQGAKELVSDGRTFMAGASSLVALRTGTHAMSDLLPEGAQYSSTIISADRSLLKQMLPETSTGRVDERAAVTTVDEETDALVSSLRSRIESTESKAEQLLTVKQVLVSLLLHEPIRVLVNSDVCGWQVTDEARIRQVMSAHCYSPLRLGHYASLCAMSVSTFKRVFRDVYQTSPGRWLIAIRLERAADLLQNTNRSVTEISLESGFGDLSHFIRSFSKRFGAPPTKFRNRVNTTT